MKVRLSYQYMTSTANNYFVYAAQVYIPCLEGYLPTDIVKTFCHLLDFIYLVRRAILNDDTIEAIQKALEQFHGCRDIFITKGVRKDFNLPRQHSMVHYIHLIEMFGAPNGLCTSITESQHRVVVKDTYKRSNKFQALGQMLLTNQRSEKLAASLVDFRNWGLLSLPTIKSLLMDLLTPFQSASGSGIGNDDDNDDNEDHDGNVDVSRYDGEVKLANQARKRINLCYKYLILIH